MGFDGTGKGSFKSGSTKKENKDGGDGGDDEAMDMDMEDSDEEEKKDGNNNEEDEDEDDHTRQIPIRGPIPSEPGRWGSCVRLVDPGNACSTLDCVEMNRNEAA